MFVLCQCHHRAGILMQIRDCTYMYDENTLHIYAQCMLEAVSVRSQNEANSHTEHGRLPIVKKAWPCTEFAMYQSINYYSVAVNAPVSYLKCPPR